MLTESQELTVFLLSDGGIGRESSVSRPVELSRGGGNHMTGPRTLVQEWNPDHYPRPLLLLPYSILPPLEGG